MQLGVTCIYCTSKCEDGCGTACAWFWHVKHVNYPIWLFKAHQPGPGCKKGGRLKVFKAKLDNLYITTITLPNPLMSKMGNTSLETVYLQCNWIWETRQHISEAAAGSLVYLYLDHRSSLGPRQAPVSGILHILCSWSLFLSNPGSHHSVTSYLCQPPG